MCSAVSFPFMSYLLLLIAKFATSSLRFNLRTNSLCKSKSESVGLTGRSCICFPVELETSMPETLQTNYKAISDMGQEGATVPWKKFYVHLAGKTNNTHRDFVARFKRTGQTEVDSPGRSDYILVFCPIVSRVGTDIGEALESTEKNNPGGKPIILVVMHHTFDPDRVIAESRRLVNNPNVRLTVDCLIYDNKFLTCDRNDIALYEVLKIFGVSPTQDSGCSDCSGWVRDNRLAFFILFCILCIVIALLVILPIMLIR